MGVKVKDYHDPLNPECAIENEFDILLMRDNHLHMIECKIGNGATRDEELTDIIYKYIALAQILDDDGKMIIATKSGVYKPESSDNLSKRKISKRAMRNDILVRGFAGRKPEVFQKEVAEFFNLCG